MNKLAALICNYNGKDFVVNCIYSLLQQTCQNFDIWLVDNASSDGSVKEIKNIFGDMVNILQSEENLGGTGGFNFGLKACLEKDYSYVLMLDNDVKLEKQCIEKLMYVMESNPLMGALGARIMIMGAPEHIQEYGSYVDHDTCDIDLGYYYMRAENLPEMVLCDYIPACVAMVRMDIIRKIGVMPEENFIYWDDIEFCHSIIKEGYQVAAYRDAVAWHRGGYKRKAVSTFVAYYYKRNRIRFIRKYAAKEDLNRVTAILLRNLFQYIYGSYHKRMYPSVKSSIYSLVDGFLNVTGKQEKKVFPYEEDEMEWLTQVKGDVLIILRDVDKDTQKKKLPLMIKGLLLLWQEKGCTADYTISLENTSYSVKEFNTIFFDLEESDLTSNVIVADHVAEKDAYNYVLEFFRHITDVETYTSGKGYVDRFNNYIGSDTEFAFISQFEEKYEQFQNWFMNEYQNGTLNCEDAEEKIFDILKNRCI